MTDRPRAGVSVRSGEFTGHDAAFVLRAPGPVGCRAALVGIPGCRVGGADPTAGSGLSGLAERVALSGGRLRLSNPTGGPALLWVELPIA